MPFDQLKRREFITLGGGAAAAWPMWAVAFEPLPKVSDVVSGILSRALVHCSTVFRAGV
jgi:hypothetical protein